jgi:hypothetical protein
MHFMKRKLATMNRFFSVLAFTCFASIAQAGDVRQLEINHEKYSRSVFDEMPHPLILRLQKQKCRDNSVAAGNEKQEQVCIDEVDNAFDLLSKANQLHQIPDATWRLCLGSARDGTSYDYRVWVKCLKVAISICKMTETGNYIDKPACMRMIESGAWINNTKAR